MNRDTIIGYAIVAIFSGIVGYLLKYVSPKSKLVIWFPHAFLYRITPQNVNIHTQTYTIQNLGYERAEEIEIVHKRKPDFFQLNPSLNYVEAPTPSGEHVIKIASLAPKEFFALEILSHTSLPEFQYVRCKDGHAERIDFSLHRKQLKWAQNALRAIMLLGFATLAYLLYRGATLMAA